MMSHPLVAGSHQSAKSEYRVHDALGSSSTHDLLSTEPYYNNIRFDV